ncbi:MAG: TIGR02147 family protein [Pseudobdellovibrionaceae bacterium]
MNIFEQNDYKEALKLYIRKKEKSVQRGAFKNLAEYLGVHATLVSQILSGTKDFTEEQIFSVCEFFGIPKLESHYLWILVQIERAGSIKLKKHYIELKEQLRNQALNLSNRVEKAHELTESEKAIFYSSWFYSAIQVATTLDRNVDFEFICERFNLIPTKAREVLDFLIQIQMIKEKDGRFFPGTTSTHLENKSPFIAKHHTNWRLKAIEATENLLDEELIYSANVTISRVDFVRLREEMVQLVQRFLTVVKDSPAEDIAQFNLDFFWLKK